MLFAVPANAREVVITLPSSWNIKAEIAETRQQREKGLMFRKSLSGEKGMLFVFEEESLQVFWMKNTWLDLDIIYIGKDNRITRIFHRVPRSYKDTPDSGVATVRGSGKYVLEMTAGFAREHRLWPGQKLKFNLTSFKKDRKK